MLGSTTLRVKAAAIAASKAFPPWAKMVLPAWVAKG